MKQKTYQELEKELVDSKKREEKLKERVSTLRSELTGQKRYMKSLIGQYERVIKDWKRISTEYQNNISKFFFVSVFQKMKTKLGR